MFHAYTVLSFEEGFGVAFRPYYKEGTNMQGKSGRKRGPLNSFETTGKRTRQRQIDSISLIQHRAHPLSSP